MVTRRGVVRSAVGAAVSAVVPRPVRPQASDSVSLTARIRTDLERHASFGYKYAGSIGDLATADWVSSRLLGSGYHVETQAAEMPFWEERVARLRAGSVSVDVQPQSPVITTSSDGLSAPLALVEDSIPQVRGMIAIYLTPFGRHAAISRGNEIGRTVTELANRGASAVVVVTRGPSREAIGLNVRPEEPFVPVPMALLAPKNADAVISAAAAGATGTLILDGQAGSRSSPNIVAYLERGERWIAVSTPRSGWYHCVAERGTGTVAFLEIADWAVKRFPGHSIWLLNSGGHEYYFAGSEQFFADPQDVLLPAPESTSVWVHIGATLAVRGTEDRNGELVMLDSPDPDRRLMGSTHAHDALAQAFRGLSGYSTPSPVGGGELPVFLDRGYRTGFATIATHAWFHTIKDTIERVDENHLVEVVRAYQRGIEFLADA